jgi:hypothetical protein
MDTRQLRVIKATDNQPEMAGAAHIEDQHGNRLVNYMFENYAEELVKRFNAYPQLIAAMQWFCERVDKGEVKSVRTYALFKELLGISTPAQDGHLPFTVVLRYDDPDADNDRTASDHVFVVDKATSPEDAAKQAIEALMVSELSVQPGEGYKATEAYTSFTPIAIYPGHLQNLAK